MVGGAAYDRPWAPTGVSASRWACGNSIVPGWGSAISPLSSWFAGVDMVRSTAVSSYSPTNLLRRICDRKVLRRMTKVHALIDVPRSKRSREAHALTIVSRSEEHTSELQSLMRHSYAVFCLKKKQIRTKQQ